MMKKIILLLSASMLAIDAKAGTFTPVGTATNPSVTTGCSDNFTGPPPGFGYLSNSLSDPPGGTSYNSASGTFEWEWVPNGTLENDPVPSRSGTHTYKLLGGSIVATATGVARADGVANLVPGGIFEAETIDRPSPDTVTLSGTNQTELVYPSVVAGFPTHVKVTVTLKAKSSSYIIAGYSGNGITTFGNAGYVGIQSKGVSP